MFGITKTFKFIPKHKGDDAGEQALQEAMSRVQPVAEERMIQDADISLVEEIGEDFDEQEKVEDATPKKVSVMVGRIRFEGIIAAPEAPTDLICEECERRFASVYCGSCEQVFCHKCASLCHMIEELGEIMHPHEKEGAVRPLEVGDTSRVRKVHEWNLPEGIFSEEDMAKRRDITQPNALALNVDHNPVPSRTVHRNPLYDVGDQLLFIDPATGEEAYGRVVSEWDLRHGNVAPSVVRGEGTGVMYLVDMINHVKGNVRDYRDLVRKRPDAEDARSVPTLTQVDGTALVDNPLRADKYAAQDINRKLYDLHEYNKYGPRYHLKKDFPPLVAMKGGAPDRTVSFPEAPRPEDEEAVIEALAAAAAPDSPRAAALRRYHNVIGDGSDPSRGVRLLVLPESALERPEHRHGAIVAGNNAFLVRVVESCLMTKWRTDCKWAIDIWISKMHQMRNDQIYRAARSIQSLGRMWLLRNKLEDMYDIWEAELFRRWQVVRGKFGWTHMKADYAVTMDFKNYFRTHTDVNRYADFLRKSCGKFFMFFNRKRMIQLRRAIHKWKGNVDGFNESDLKNSHFLPWAIDAEDDEQTPLEQQKRAALFLAPILTGGRSASVARGLAIGDSEALKEEGLLRDNGDYDSLSLQPLAVGVNIGQGGQYAQDGVPEGGFLDPTLPPWHPSIGCTLEPLPTLYMPKTAEERLHITDKKRLRMNAFQAHCEGPSDNSCWVMPRRLAMGGYPLGRARARMRTSCVAALLMAGVDTFVSLMTEEEEAELEVRNGETVEYPVPEAIEHSCKYAAKEASQVQMDSKRIISEMKQGMKNIVNYDKEHPRYPAARRERIRLQGRVDLAEQTIARMKAAMNSYPTDPKFLRIPMNQNDCPTLEEILPTIWELERLYREGRKLYIYSREGHGRCGLLAGALLGRLYGLSHYDAAYRLQACHDVTPNFIDMPIKVHCPQLWQQQRLLQELLDTCNRFFQGTQWRTRRNPEIYQDQLHRRKRAVPERLQSEMQSEDIQERTITTINWRDSLETQSETAREQLGSEDVRQRRDGYLNKDDVALPPQHHRDTVVYGFSKEPRVPAKMEGELSVTRVKPSTGAKSIPSLRVRRDGK